MEKSYVSDLPSQGLDVYQRNVLKREGLIGWKREMLPTSLLKCLMHINENRIDLKKNYVNDLSPQVFDVCHVKC